MKTCQTCKWWNDAHMSNQYLSDELKQYGDCLAINPGGGNWYTAIGSHLPIKLNPEDPHVGVSVMTKPDFGCTMHEESP